MARSRTSPTSLRRRARRTQAERRLPLSFVVVLAVMVLLFVVFAMRNGEHVPSAAHASAEASMIPRPAVLDFDGARAYDHVRALVEMGPRSVGSAGHDKAVDYIVKTLQGYGLAPERMTFTADTPDGRFAMTNVIVTIGTPLAPLSAPPTPVAASRFPGAPNADLPSPDRDTVVLAAHYDTKRFPFPFVGANDGGSGTAALLEMARVLSKRPPARPVVLVFFDGEEAFHEWSDTDSRYGSRYLAEVWRATDVLSRIRAFILMDMIGDDDPHFMRDANSSRWVQNRIWQQAAAQGRGALFSDEAMAIEDDHLPFLTLGVPSAVLIDFEYGPRNSYWHTDKDTLDKISAKSLETVGRVIEGTTREL